MENLTASTRSLSPATSCSILVSVSFILISCPFASSLILPFSRLRSNLTEAWVRLISSRSREFSLAKSPAIRSCEERVSCASVESELRSSERSLAKSTFCVYADRSASTQELETRQYHQMQQGDTPSLKTIVLVKFCIDSSITSLSTLINATACSSLNPSLFNR